MKRIVVHIDRLVLDGYRYEDRHIIAAGLQQELVRLLAEPGMAGRLTDLGDAARLRSGNISIGHAARPAQIGVAAAGGIAKGIVR